MAQATDKLLPQLRLTLSQLTPWQGFIARNDFRVYPFELGAQAAAASTGTAVTCHGMGDFAVGDYIMVCTKTSYGAGFLWVPKVTRVSKILAKDVGGNDVLTIDDSLIVADGDYVLNLGVDGAAPSPTVTPDFDGFSVTIYDTPVEDGGSEVENTDKFWSTGSMGQVIGWFASGSSGATYDLLITDTTPTVQIIIPGIQLPLIVT